MHGWTETACAWYLAAIIDGEGWVRKPDPKFGHGQLTVANTDMDVIEATIRCLDSLGIKYARYHYAYPPESRRQPVDVLSITGRSNLRIVYERVPIQTRRKRERLAGLLVLPPPPREPLDPVALRRLYYDQRLTVREVAQQLGVGYKRVQYAMTAHGMPRRDHTDRKESTWRTRRARYGSAGRRFPDARGQDAGTIGPPPGPI